MKRRSFLGLLGVLPLVPLVKPEGRRSAALEAYEDGLIEVDDYVFPAADLADSQRRYAYVVRELEKTWHQTSFTLDNQRRLT